MTYTHNSISTTLSIPRRHGIAFFNTASARACRLNSYDHHPTPSDRKRWCVLCRKDGMGDLNKGRTAVCHCSKCTVSLCLSVPANIAKNFWYMWHMIQTLQPRHIGAAVPRTTCPSSDTAKPVGRGAPSTPGSAVARRPANVSEIVNLSTFRAQTPAPDTAATNRNVEMQSSTPLRRSTRRRCVQQVVSSDDEVQDLTADSPVQRHHVRRIHSLPSSPSPERASRQLFGNASTSLSHQTRHYSYRGADTVAPARSVECGRR